MNNEMAFILTKLLVDQIHLFITRHLSDGASKPSLSAVRA